jgi:hypothetical protein
VVWLSVENRAKPKVRRQQLEELLSQDNETSNPVVIAGDLNTTGSDSTPTSVQNMLYKQFGSADFTPAVSIPCMPWQLLLSPLSLPTAIETIVGFPLSRTAWPAQSASPASPGAIIFRRTFSSVEPRDL